MIPGNPILYRYSKNIQSFLLVVIFTLSQACKKPKQTTALDPHTLTWAEILAAPDPAAFKVDKYRSCVLHLCKSGRAYEAIGLIEKSFERGELRSILISAVFSSESLAFPELCSMESELGESDDRPAALSGIAEVIARMDGLAVLSSEDLKKLGDGASVAVGDGLAKFIEFIGTNS